MVVEGEAVSAACLWMTSWASSSGHQVAEANYRKVEGISGATILGDGSVALILDIPGLMRLAKQGGAALVPLALTA